MSSNPECPSCPIGDNTNLCFFAGRVEKVYTSDAITSSPHENKVIAEEAICQSEIAPDDIDRLTTKLKADIALSLAGCFIPLHERARADQEILATLTDEQKVAVAGCATYRLRRTCEL